MRIAQYHWEKRFEEFHTRLERQLFSFVPEEYQIIVKFENEELKFDSKAELSKEIRRRNEISSKQGYKGFLALKRSYHGNTLMAAGVSYRLGKDSQHYKATFIDADDPQKRPEFNTTKFPDFGNQYFRK